MKVSYISQWGSLSEHPPVGTPLEIHDVDWILEWCARMQKMQKKHKNGAVFPYLSDKVGKEYLDTSRWNDGVIFIDIDYITKDTAETIYNNFEELCKYMPCLYAIQYSSSYYNNPSKSGLHIYAIGGKRDEATLALYNDEAGYTYLANVAMSMFAYYVYHVLKIDLRISQIGNNKILDDSIYRATQRFFLFYSTYKKNENCEELTENIDANSINELQKNWLLARKKTTVKNIIHAPVNYGQYEPTYIDKEPVCVDRNFKLRDYKGKEHSGNDMRWRINIWLQKICGDQLGKYICERYFYYESGESFWTPINDIDKKYIDEWLSDWLVSEGYFKENTNRPRTISRDGFISEYYDMIVEFINKHERSEIVCPTGTGKTTLINGNCDIESLAAKMNAVVIVPFNVTNKLYDNMIEVSSSTRNKPDEDKPCVMIWDKAIQWWQYIKDRFLIIDEAHALFLDRQYRDTAVQLMKRIKEDRCKFVMFTATPSGEASELNAETLTFMKHMRPIETTIQPVYDTAKSEYMLIKNFMKHYDRICVFDDTTAKRLYEKLLCDGVPMDDIAYIRADTKDSSDFISLRDNERLTKKITICTKLAFCGLNFNNDKIKRYRIYNNGMIHEYETPERILVINSIVSGSTTSCDIIQQVGRFRKCNVEMRIFVGRNTNNDIAERIEKAKTFNEIESKLNLETELLQYDRRLVDDDISCALERIDTYIKEHSTLDKIKEELIDAGYFNIIELEPNDFKSKLNLEKKKQASDIYKKDIQDKVSLTNDYDTIYANDAYLRRYLKEFQTDERKLTQGTIKGITQDKLIEMINKKNKNVLMSTVFDNMNEIIRIATVPEESWKHYVNSKDMIINMLNGQDKYIKEFLSKYNKQIKIRNKYNGKIVIEDTGFIDATGAVDDFIDELVMKSEEERINRSSSHNRPIIIYKYMSEKMLDKYNLKIGDKFSSVNELCKYANVSRMQVTRWHASGVWVFENEITT